jgi:hypothetical protein
MDIAVFLVYLGVAMKSFLAKALVLITCFVSIHASAQEAVEGDLRGKAEFVRTCPRKFRTSSYEATSN